MRLPGAGVALARCARRTLGLALLVPVLFGCAGPALSGTPAVNSASQSSAALLAREYWTGVRFNGQKIGFSHLRIRPADHGYRVDSETSLRFHLLGLDKQVVTKSTDWIAPDLTLRRFDYLFDMDGNQMRISGKVEAKQLVATIDSGGEVHTETLPLTGPVLPTSVIDLYPALHGFAKGSQFHFAVYDGETRSVSECDISVLALERGDQFTGKAWKVETRLLGQTVTSWIDSQGVPLREFALGGAFVSSREDEGSARQFLIAAALNKDEALLTFSRVKSSYPIVDPRHLKRMQVRLSGLTGLTPPIAASIQQCAVKGGDWQCAINSAGGAATIDPAPYLQPSVAVPSQAAPIVELASKIAGQGDDHARAERLMNWVFREIKPRAVDAFTALDVLRRREGECQGHSYLYAAFARATGVPTRIVNGLVYAGEYGGFLYHTWTESRLDGRWVAVDPTFGQLPADATHIKLIEGDSPAQLSPMVNVIGRVRLQVLNTDYR